MDESLEARFASAMLLNERQLGLIESLSSDAARMRSQIDDLERLRSRATVEAGALRADLNVRADAFSELDQKHQFLMRRFVLVTDQLDVLTAERAAIERQCKRLEAAAAGSRERTLAAERSLHEYLIGFADDLASVAAYPRNVLFITGLRERVAALLDQLAASNEQLGIVNERLARNEGTLALRAIRRVKRSRAYSRLRSLVRA